MAARRVRFAGTFFNGRAGPDLHAHPAQLSFQRVVMTLKPPLKVTELFAAAARARVGADMDARPKPGHGDAV